MKNIPQFVLNVPNILTLFRIMMIPLVCLPLLPIFGMHTFAKLLMTIIFFSLASITDFLDGYLARKWNQQTQWGAYMDPLIDKFLMWGVFGEFLFISFLQIPLWTFIVIVSRDIIVTALRNYALRENIFFKTSYLAKIKTASQMAVVFIILLFLFVTFIFNRKNGANVENYLVFWKEYQLLYYMPRNLVVFVSLLTLISGLDYLKYLKKS